MTAHSLTSADLIIVVLYLLTLLIIGIRAARNQAADSYLIAERKLGVLSAVATMNATKTGSIIILFTAFIYAYGMSAIWYFVGMSVGYLIFLPFALHLHKKSEGNYYTLADYYHYNYGEKAAKFASLACIFAMFGSMIINLIAATKTFSFFSGYNYTASALIIAGVILFYLLFAGFKAVVSTDVFQYLAIISILLLFFFILFGSSEIPAAEWDMSQAGLKNITGFFLLGILLPFAQPELWQRVYAVPNKSVLKRSILISIVIHFSVAFILALVGLTIKSLLPDIEPDMALIEGFARLLPSGLIGLAVIIFFSAMMSSIDTYAFTTSSCVVQDFFRGCSTEDSVRLIRLTLIFTILLGTWISILYNNLIGAAFVLSGYVIQISIPTLFTWARPNAANRILNISIPLSMVILTAVVAYDFISDALNPTLILKAIGISLICLIVGVILNRINPDAT